jgi:hypothetical protein
LGGFYGHENKPLDSIKFVGQLSDLALKKNTGNKMIQKGESNIFIFKTVLL